MSLLVASVSGQTTNNITNGQFIAVEENQQIVVPQEEKIESKEDSMDEKADDGSEKELKQFKTTRESVEDYFEEIPVMIEVARCESEFRQFNSDGTVLRGRANSADVGVMQINEKYHADTAVKLGYNIYSLEGNMAYAKYLYDTQGTKPWVHSSKCWNSVREVAFVN